MNQVHRGLIYLMVLTSASDGTMTDSEIDSLGRMVSFLPVFAGFDAGDIAELAGECVDLLRDENGVDRTLEAVRDFLPEDLRETAYAIACEVVAADGSASQEELRLLEMVRHKLDIDRLHAAAIERGIRARLMPLHTGAP